VADVVFDLIQKEQFYILTHPEWTELIRLRTDSLLRMENPQSPVATIVKLMNNRRVVATNSPRYFGAATMGSMALIVFFRGINVGGHRAFRPSVLAKELGIYGAVNVGAAGTLVIRKPGLRAKFLAELRRKLPFEATIAFCDSRDLIRLETDNPFGTEPPPADVVQFVSILSKAGRRKVPFPITLPEGGEWLVRIIGSKNRLVYGVYRRQMRTIGYLGQIDRLFGAPATTRSWSTILSVLRILKSGEPDL
jgi:uncharacterized protein (DUF1697 family)